MKSPFLSSKSAYIPLRNVDEEGEVVDRDEIKQPERTNTRYRFRHVLALIVLFIVTVVAIVAFVSIVSSIRSNPSTGPDGTDASSSCPLRREWRTLTPNEQQHYITSVHCLTSIPSKIHKDSTLYEDFPWVHSHVGYSTHHSAPFLPWHRYFLQLYHQELREQCNYTGELVYWDWTLDWEDLAHSPVFDPETGFGGDGDPNGEITIGKTGRCVIDGPFKNIQAKYYDVKYLPHCLSRGFRDDYGSLGVIGNGETISPAAIAEVLALRSYEEFVDALENKVHDTIPFGVGGDFETFTAPNDPLFYLHHTQLDRLWWTWQQRQPNHGLEAYGGHGHRHSIEPAKLTDKITYQNFAPGIQVQDTMSTESDLLCYRY